MNTLINRHVNSINKPTPVISTVTSSTSKSTASIHVPPLTRKSQLYSVITNEDGSPDYLTICLYWDYFRSWYTPNKLKLADGSIVEVPKLKTKGIYTDYGKLANLYKCSKETIRKKIVKLEKLGLALRSFKHKSTATTKSYNQLVIYIWKDTPLFTSKYGISLDEIPEIKPQTNHKYITQKYNIDYSPKAQLNQANLSRGGIHTLEDTKELIEPFNKLKDRSTKSNSCSKVLKDKKNESLEIKLKNTKNNLSKSNQTKVCNSNKPNTNNQPLVKNKLSSKIKTFFCRKPKSLSDFHPLSDSDCSILRSESGRDFTDNAINEILQDMSKRLQDREFKSKKAFLSYMSKALTFEMRDAVQISGENFRIKANQTSEEKTKSIEESYLKEIEYSLQVSPEWHLKKKLAATLERSKAYQLLHSYKSIEKKEGKAIIYLTKRVELSQMDKHIILSQIQASHDGVNGGELSQDIESLEIKYQSDNRLKTQTTSNKEQSRAGKIHPIKNSTQSREKEEYLKEEWQKTRQAFISSFDDESKEEALAIDSHWLSKLNANINTEDKTIKLEAPNNFFKEMIEDRYLELVKNAAKLIGYEVPGIICS